MVSWLRTEEETKEGKRKGGGRKRGGGGEQYVLSRDFLAAKHLNRIIHLVMGAEVGVGQDLLVYGPGIRYNAGDILADVSEVGSGGGNVAVACDEGTVEQEVTVEATGGQAREADLVPPADVDDGIGQVQPLDVVQHGLLLHMRAVSQSFIRRSCAPARRQTGGQTSSRRDMMPLGITVA